MTYLPLLFSILLNSCQLVSTVWDYTRSISPTVYKGFSSFQTLSNVPLLRYIVYSIKYPLWSDACAVLFFSSNHSLFRNGTTLSLVWVCVSVHFLFSSSIHLYSHLILIKVYFKHNNSPVAFQAFSVAPNSLYGRVKELHRHGNMVLHSVSRATWKEQSVT